MRARAISSAAATSWSMRVAEPDPPHPSVERRRPRIASAWRISGWKMTSRAKPMKSGNLRSSQPSTSKRKTIVRAMSPASTRASPKSI